MKGNKHTPAEDKVGLPIFPYHPDPVGTGSVREGEGRCACCGQARGFVYAAPIYTAGSRPEVLCPWCIADGSAAEKFDATFADGQPLVEAALPKSVIEEVTQRTPGYQSWQGDSWQACCGDACEFHGDARRGGIVLLDPAATEQFLATTHWSPEQWQEFVAAYEPGGSPALYHFVCRGCRSAKLSWDCD